MLQSIATMVSINVHMSETRSLNVYGGDTWISFKVLLLFLSILRLKLSQW